MRAPVGRQRRWVGATMLHHRPEELVSGAFQSRVDVVEGRQHLRTQRTDGVKRLRELRIDEREHAEAVQQQGPCVKRLASGELSLGGATEVGELVEERVVQPTDALE